MNQNSNALDLTRDGIVFEAWDTPFANSHLVLESLVFDGGKKILEAIFCEPASDKRATFIFADCATFRVLDERGLTEIWHASSEKPRPAQTTFKVRGHAWQLESPLEWLWNCDEPYFSYMIATNNECLEAIAPKPPAVKLGLA